jgi:hydroxylaminobenzene mutase
MRGRLNRTLAWRQPDFLAFLCESASGNERKIAQMRDIDRRLMFHGMFLFLLGLLTGFAEQHFANVRMGLAAHLEGLMNGIFLLALGGIWTHVRLSTTATAIAFWAVLYGTYLNWFTTVLAAIFGTAALSPITGAGHSGQPWQETFVTVGFMSVGIAIVIASVLIVWGLRKEVSR